MSAECGLLVVLFNPTVQGLPSEEHPSPQQRLSPERCTMGGVLGQLPDIDHHYVSAGWSHPHRHSHLLLLLLQVWEDRKQKGRFADGETDQSQEGPSESQENRDPAEAWWNQAEIRHSKGKSIRPHGWSLGVMSVKRIFLMPVTMKYSRMSTCWWTVINVSVTELKIKKKLYA